MSFDKFQYSFIKQSMEDYDALPPEMRALIQEYGEMPVPLETPERYQKRQAQYRKFENDYIDQELMRCAS